MSGHFFLFAAVILIALILRLCLVRFWVSLVVDCDCSMLLRKSFCRQFAVLYLCLRVVWHEFDQVFSVLAHRKVRFADIIHSCDWVHQIIVYGIFIVFALRSDDKFTHDEILVIVALNLTYSVLPTVVMAYVFLDNVFNRLVFFRMLAFYTFRFLSFFNGVIGVCLL